MGRAGCTWSHVEHATNLYNYPFATTEGETEVYAHNRGLAGRRFSVDAELLFLYISSDFWNHKRTNSLLDGDA